MDTKDLIYKHFKDETSIWFDFVDRIKANYQLQRKGLGYRKNNGLYEIYGMNDDGESILLDVLDENQGYKLEKYIEAFSS